MKLVTWISSFSESHVRLRTASNWVFSPHLEFMSSEMPTCLSINLSNISSITPLPKCHSFHCSSHMPHPNWYVNWNLHPCWLVWRLHSFDPTTPVFLHYLLHLLYKGCIIWQVEGIHFTFFNYSLHMEGNGMHHIPNVINLCNCSFLVMFLLTI